MISMITCRSDLYQRLWDEYFQLDSDKKQESFFYKYMKRKKDDQAARLAADPDALADYSTRKKRDKYVLLRSAYLIYKNNILSEKEYITRLTDLAGSKDKKISAIPEPLTAENIDELERFYEKVFLTGCIGDFFYNMGFRLRNTTDKEKNKDIGEIGYAKLGERYLKEKDGYIDDLDLWASYYISQLKDEPQPPGFVSELTNDYIVKCQHLFTVMNREGRDNAFLPLYYDHGTGAGVIIVGSNILSEEETNENSCRICIAYFSSLGTEINQFGEFDVTMMTELFDDVNIAFERFKKGVAAREYSENYSDQNDALPDGIDSIFSHYFYERKKKEPSYDVIIKEYSRKEKAAHLKRLEEKEKRLQHLRQFC